MPVDLNEDRMLASMRVLDAADRLNAQAARDTQMELQVKEYDLNRRRTEVAEAQQRNVLDSELRKTTAAKALADFSAVYDPTDTDHRSKLDWYRNWAVGEGMSAQEVGQGFANADNKTAAMDSQLASLRAQSGIQDWETTQTQDGRKIIDVASTISKSNYMKEQLDKEAASWTFNDRLLERSLIEKNALGGSRPEIRAMVNENRRTLEDYKTVVGQELWNPPANFAEKFTYGVASNDDSIGYSPKMYAREALEQEKGYLKARGYAVRVASGEEPVFKRDANGNVEYDADNVAKVERWVNPKRESAIAETDKKTAEARTAQNQADLDAKYGDTAYRAKAAAQIQAATSTSFDPATREAGQAEISALFGGGAAAPAGQNTNGDAGKPISTYKKSK